MVSGLQANYERINQWNKVETTILDSFLHNFATKDAQWEKLSIAWSLLCQMCVFSKYPSSFSILLTVLISSAVDQDKARLAIGGIPT